MSPTFIDITLPISERVPVWPGDPPVEITRPDRELPAIVRLSMGNHAGTHVDAPAHFFPGRATVDALPLEVMIGPAWVVHLPGTAAITAAMLANAGIPHGAPRLLIRTDNSDRAAMITAFDPDYVALTSDAADWLLARGIRLLGIDGPSVDLFTASDSPVHRALLAAGAIIIERLALSGVEPGAYELVCLPLPITQCDGAPARVILISA